MKLIKLAMFIASVITTNCLLAAHRMPGPDGFPSAKAAGGSHRSPKATGAATNASATSVTSRLAAVSAPFAPGKASTSVAASTRSGTPSPEKAWTPVAAQTPAADMRTIMATEAATNPTARPHRGAKDTTSSGAAAPSAAPVLPISPTPKAAELNSAGSSSPKAVSPKDLTVTSTGVTSVAATTVAAFNVEARSGSPTRLDTVPLRSSSPSAPSRSASPHRPSSDLTGSGMAAPGSLSSATTSHTSVLPTPPAIPKPLATAATTSYVGAAGAGSGPSVTATYADDDFTLVRVGTDVSVRGRDLLRRDSAGTRSRSATPALWQKTSTRNLGWAATLRPHRTTLGIFDGFIAASPDVDSAELHKGAHIAVDLARRERGLHKSVRITPVDPATFDVASASAVVNQLAARGKGFTPHLDTLGDLNLLCLEGQIAAARSIAQIKPLVIDFQAAVDAQHTTVGIFRGFNKRCKSPETSRASAGIGISDEIESLTTAFRTALMYAARTTDKEA